MSGGAQSPLIQTPDELLWEMRVLGSSHRMLRYGGYYATNLNCFMSPLGTLKALLCLLVATKYALVLQANLGIFRALTAVNQHQIRLQ